MLDIGSITQPIEVYTYEQRTLSSVTARLLRYGWGAALLALADLRARCPRSLGLLGCWLCCTIPQFLPVCWSVSVTTSLSRHGRKRPEERGERMSLLLRRRKKNLCPGFAEARITTPRVCRYHRVQKTDRLRGLRERANLRGLFSILITPEYIPTCSDRRVGS